MNVKNCARCGKVINSGPIELCDECTEKERIEFGKIKAYLETNPGATVFQVSTDLNVSIKNIKRYLREDRLEIADRGAKTTSFLTCIKCGAPIRSGYYCISCATSVKFNKDLAPAANKDTTSESPQKSGIRFSQKKPKDDI